MSRPNPIALSAIFAVIIAIFAGLLYAKGGLYLDSHEADIYHLLDVIFRMAQGQVPHLDFTTPLGILTFIPIVEFVKADFSFAQAFLASQLLLAVLLLPFTVYACWTRLSTRQAIAFGGVVFLLVLTMAFTSERSGVTAAMYYNRWAWAIAFVALLVSFCPPVCDATARPKTDGTIVGVLATALLLIKVSYFAALVPAMTAAFLVRKQPASVIAALITGMVLLAVSTIHLGFGFWAGYFADLLNVSASTVRPNVGVSMGVLVSGAPFIGATLTGIAAALLIRRAGHDAMGLVVFLLLFPGFVFISYQNFGNGPTWLLFLSFLLLVYRPQNGFGLIWGKDLRDCMSALALIAVLVNLPSFYVMARSPLDHLAFNTNEFRPYLSDPKQNDFFIRTDRATLMTALVALDDKEGVWQKYREPAGRGDMTEFGGVRIPECELAAGSHAHMNELANRLKADGVPAGAQLFSTDFLIAFWLFGDFVPLEHGAPWYYGGLTGIENADYLLIPKCVFSGRLRDLIIDELIEAELPMTLAQNNDLYLLFELD